jgi:voltage-gated potassium channel
MDTPYVVGDATEEDTLRRAGIDRAAAVVAALTTDADNVFVALTARALRPDLFIVARARDATSLDKLRRAGADRVVNPQDLGGARMAAFVEQPHVAAFVDVVMHDRSLEFRLEEVVVPASSPLIGCTLAHSRVRERTGALVLAVGDGAGNFATNPAPELALAAGQVLIAIGTEVQLGELDRLVSAGPAARPAAPERA